MSLNLIEEIKKLSPERRELLGQLLQKEAPHSARLIIVPRLRKSNHVPLSFAQQRLWFLDQLQPGGHAFNLPIALRVWGPLNTEVLQKSLSEIVRRHEVLRTSFTFIGDQPMQVINPPSEWSLPVEDLRVLPDELREAEVLRQSTDETRQPFDLGRGPLLRVRLLRTGEQEHVILFTMHHIVADAWSSGVLVDEVMALYGAYAAGRSSPLPELPIQYADFALWQREMLTGETLDGLLGYWQRQLQGVAQLKLPSDRPRPAVTSYRGASESVFIDETLTSSLKSLGQQEGVTLFMTLLAAFQTLLYLYTKQTDIVVGTDIANRTRAETERLIGFFVNMLALRTDLSGNPTFREILKRVQQVTVDAYAHQELPFEKLVAALNLERELNRFPIFQAVFVLQNAPVRMLEISGLDMEPVAIEHLTVKFDLIMFLAEQQGRLLGRLDYSTDLFDAGTIRSFVKNFQTTLERVVAEPDVQLDRLQTITERKEELPDKEKEARARKRLGIVKRKTLAVA
ncbi:MAG TPA: condensation domain-containing protein [Pyrinomonadaceae bacterium]|nr:condensation domain-containing protein [Pyrinomonadaceae bacterium]